MGVAGAGKTTVGQALAERLDWVFFDADAFHSLENVAKMRAGTPLDDEARAAWLASLHALISEHLTGGESLVLACSALKESYRDTLRCGQEERVYFVYLQGDFTLIEHRLQHRKHHYMHAALLESQFEALEPPRDALVLDAGIPVEALVEQVVYTFRQVAS